MALKIVRNDITKMQVDAIVNTANKNPIYSAGVDSAIYKAAGEDKLLNERKKIGNMEEGEVAITAGFNLQAKYIIHAVSPCYIDGESGEEDKLRSCYNKSLRLAYKHKCRSIAFPLISTGCLNYPKEEAMRIAVDEINAFLLWHNMLVYLVVFDTTSTNLGMNLYPDLEAYIDHNYVCDKHEEEYCDRYFGSVRNNFPVYDAYRNLRTRVENAVKRRVNDSARAGGMTENAMKADFASRDVKASDETCCDELHEVKEQCELIETHNSEENYQQTDTSDAKTFACRSMPMGDAACSRQKMCDISDMDDEEYTKFIEEKEHTIEERMKHMTDTFQEYLFYLIEQKKLENVSVYKRAIIDKRQFSKIKKNPAYHPDKATALRLCVGALLNLDETKDLLARAGYALSPCDKRDIIFSYFIEKEIYDVTEIDITLEEHGLGCFIA